MASSLAQSSYIDTAKNTRPDQIVLRGGRQSLPDRQQTFLSSLRNTWLGAVGKSGKIGSTPLGGQTSRRGVMLVLALIVMLILTSCGAELETELTINNDGSGERVIRAQILPEDEDSLEGGFAALDEALKEHTPPELSYEGLTEPDAPASSNEADDDPGWDDDLAQLETEEAGPVATFTLSFESMEDYEAKVFELIDLYEPSYGLPGDTTYSDLLTNLDGRLVEHELYDSRLKQGFIHLEHFESHDLLRWVGPMLAQQGVIDEELSGAVIQHDSESGSLLRVGDETYTISESKIKREELTDNTFSALRLIVEMGVDRQLTLAAGYQIGGGSASSDDQVQRDTVDEIRDELQELDGVVAASETDPTTELIRDHFGEGFELVRVSTESLDATNAALQVLLQNPDAQLSIETGPNPSGTAEYLTTWTGTEVSCSSICGESTLNPNIEFLHPPAWEQHSLNNTVSSNGEFEWIVASPLPLKTLDGTTSVTWSGNVGQEFVFTVDDAMLELTGQAQNTDDEDLAAAKEAGLETLRDNFDPGEAGSIEVETADSETRFIVNFDPRAQEELNDTLATYFGAGEATEWIHRTQPSGFLFRHYELSGSPRGLWSLITGGVSGETTLQVSLPAMHVVTADGESEGARGEGGTIEIQATNDDWSVEASGPVVVDVVIIGLVLLVLVAAIILLIIFRKHIVGVFRGKKGSGNDDAASVGVPAYSTGEFVPAYSTGDFVPPAPLTPPSSPPSTPSAAATEPLVFPPAPAAPPVAPTASPESAAPSEPTPPIEPPAPAAPTVPIEPPAPAAPTAPTSPGASPESLTPATPAEPVDPEYQETQPLAESVNPENQDTQPVEDFTPDQSAEDLSPTRPINPIDSEPTDSGAPEENK